jgi:hypothetical protein
MGDDEKTKPNHGRMHRRTSSDGALFEDPYPVPKKPAPILRSGTIGRASKSARDLRVQVSFNDDDTPGNDRMTPKQPLSSSASLPLGSSPNVMSRIRGWIPKFRRNEATLNVDPRLVNIASSRSAVRLSDAAPPSSPEEYTVLESAIDTAFSFITNTPNTHSDREATQLRRTQTSLLPGTEVYSDSSIMTNVVQRPGTPTPSRPSSPTWHAATGGSLSLPTGSHLMRSAPTGTLSVAAAVYPMRSTPTGVLSVSAVSSPAPSSTMRSMSPVISKDMMIVKSVQKCVVCKCVISQFDSYVSLNCEHAVHTSCIACQRCQKKHDAKDRYDTHDHHDHHDLSYKRSAAGVSSMAGEDAAAIIAAKLASPEDKKARAELTFDDVEGIVSESRFEAYREWQQQTRKTHAPSPLNTFMRDIQDDKEDLKSVRSLRRDSTISNFSNASSTGEDETSLNVRHYSEACVVITHPSRCLEQALYIEKPCKEMAFSDDWATKSIRATRRTPVILDQALFM